MADGVPRLDRKLEIMAVLERMEAVTGSATKLPLTKRAVINPRDLQDLVAQLRNVLPSDINEALQIIRYRDTLVSQAQAEAARIRAEAEQSSLQRVSEAQVVKDAQAAAETVKREAEQDRQDILAEAEKQAAAKVEGADSYATEVLTRLEQELSALLTTARRGIDSLKEGRVLDETGPRD